MRKENAIKTLELVLEKLKNDTVAVSEFEENEHWEEGLIMRCITIFTEEKEGKNDQDQ